MALKEITEAFRNTLKENIEIGEKEKIDDLIQTHSPAKHRKILKRDYRKYINEINKEKKEVYEVCDVKITGSHSKNDTYIKRAK